MEAGRGSLETCAPAATGPTQHRFVPFERIARTLSTTNQIVEAMRGGLTDIDPSMTEIEQRLATIWAGPFEASFHPAPRPFL